MFPQSFVHSDKWFAMWSKAAEEQLARMDAAAAQIQELESQALERARAAIDEASKLMKDALAYSAELSAEWRRIGLEAARKSASAAAPEPRA